MPDSWDYSQRPHRAAALSETPLITYLLCGVCVLITAVFLVPGIVSAPFAHRVHGLFELPAQQIWDGRLYGLLTCGFVHGDLLHILFNMVWLVQLGSVLELTMGRSRYLVFFVLATVLGSAAELASTGDTGIGASGAVYAMFGLMWAGRGRFDAWRNLATRQNLNLFIGWGIFCVVTTMIGLMHIANAAHGAGFVFGLAVGYLCYAPRRRPLWAIPLTAIFVVGVLALTWMPWSGAWCWWRGNRAYERGYYAQAIPYYLRAIRLGEDPRPLWENAADAWEQLAGEAQAHNDARLKARADTEMEDARRHAGLTPEGRSDAPTGQEGGGASQLPGR